MNIDINVLAEKAGIHFYGYQPKFALDEAQMAHDSQPSMITTANGGIPWFLTNFFDTKIIDVLLTPVKAVQVVGEETKKGDWTTNTAMFIVQENTGTVSAYGDNSNSGSSDVNYNFPERQSFHYQTHIKYGQRELDMAGLARISLATAKTNSAIIRLNKFQNSSYFFGVSGLMNYGLFNDPNLSAPITPSVKAAGGVAWSLSTTTGLEVYADIQTLYSRLATQTNGNVDTSSKMVLAMSPTSETALLKTTQFNVNVMDNLKKNFPNMRIETAPEYATASGQFVQLILEEFEGVRTAFCAFTEKLRAFPVIVGNSNFSQKMAQGTFGCIIVRPIMIVSMLGV